MSHFGGKRYLNEATRNVLVKNTAVDFFKTVSDLTAGWNNSGQLNIMLFYQDFDQYKLRVLMHFNLAALVYPVSYVRLHSATFLSKSVSESALL